MVRFFLDYFEVIAAALGFFYVLLEILQKSWMWYLMFFTSIAYFFVYAQNDIYAMMLLQIYNAIICVYGIVQWKRSKDKIRSNEKIVSNNDDKKDKKDLLVVRKLRPKTAVFSIGISIVVFIVMALILEHFTNDASPWLDSLVTTLCMLATFYLSRQNIANWIVWIMCNLISVYFYYSLKMYPTTLLYAAYVAMAAWGLIHWKKRGIRID